MISRLWKQNAFLNNFFQCNIIFNNITFPSVEHAYQAAKTTNKEEQIKISQAVTSGKAKQLGRKISIRDDWSEMRIFFMTIFLIQKIFQSRIKRKTFSY